VRIAAGQKALQGFEVIPSGGTPLGTPVDLMGSYSNRPDLADALVRAVQRLRQAQRDQTSAPRSVRSTGRSERQWRVDDRLSEADACQLVAAFESGMPKWKLAERYGISESSVKRILRRHRAARATGLPAPN
jgi:hypothetical protein